MKEYVPNVDFECFTLKYRHVLTWKAGSRKWMKRQYRKQARQIARADVRNELPA